LNDNLDYMKRRVLFTAIATLLTVASWVSAKDRLLLGPPGAGQPGGCASWFTGANGAGSTSIDFRDPAHGGCDFVLSNSVAGDGNNADWRCPAFSLGPAAGGARPITFSFAYKLPDPVAAGNNVHVQFRFFDSTGTNFISERVVPVGAHTGDSAMTGYRTLVLSPIMAPPQARMADIWVDANIFAPWVSGTAQFDSFSVTTLPGSKYLGVAVSGGILVLVAIAARVARNRRPRRPV